MSRHPYQEDPQFDPYEATSKLRQLTHDLGIDMVERHLDLNDHETFLAVGRLWLVLISGTVQERERAIIATVDEIRLALYG